MAPVAAYDLAVPYPSPSSRFFKLMPFDLAATAELSQRTPCGYTAGSPPATEPSVWLGLSQWEAGYRDSARSLAAWVADLQSADGSVGVAADAPTPQWPTSLAIWLWQVVDPQQYSANISRAVEWALESRGTTIPHDPHIGHNTQLVGWSWAANTHSWLEPTAFFVMALRAAGYGNHPRVREGVRLLTDRLLPSGGCNYGNTKVLGQYLVNHLQPSGIVLWALAGEPADDQRIGRSLDYLTSSLAHRTGATSLAFALLALAAWNRVPDETADLIAEAWRRPTTRQSPYKQALVWLASLRCQSALGSANVKDHVLEGLK